MEKKTRRALANLVTLLVVVFVCNQPDFEVYKHWLVVVILAPVAFIGTYGVLYMAYDD